MKEASLLDRSLARLRTYTVLPLSYQLKYRGLGKYLAQSCYIPGWMLEHESVAYI